MSRATLYMGDAIKVMKTLQAESVQCCVTSPPYWGLRDYGIEGQLGLESTPEEYVAKLVDVFHEVRRVLRDDGTVWLVLGDSYARSWSGNSMRPEGGTQRSGEPGFQPLGDQVPARSGNVPSGLKPKDLVGIPWRVAFALQADGWWLRSDIVWSKPNPMSESVIDRPTKAHEYVFLLSKCLTYFYDADAIAEPIVYGDHNRNVDSLYRAPGQGPQRGLHRAGPGPRKTKVPSGWDTKAGAHGTIHREGRTQEPEYTDRVFSSRNARSVWEIATKPYSKAHFSTFPPELAERCINAGSKAGDTVLDPFGGSGTTAAVATGHARNAVHIDLNPEYVELARNRIGPILCDVAEMSEASA